MSDWISYVCSSDRDPDGAHGMLSAAFRPVRGGRSSVNCFLVRTGGRLALIDTGSGDYMGPTVGRLQANLAAAGVDPAGIDAVLLTHMHPDHSADRKSTRLNSSH